MNEWHVSDSNEFMMASEPPFSICYLYLGFPPPLFTHPHYELPYSRHQGCPGGGGGADAQADNITKATWLWSYTSHITKTEPNIIFNFFKKSEVFDPEFERHGLSLSYGKTVRVNTDYFHDKLKLSKCWKMSQSRKD